MALLRDRRRRRFAESPARLKPRGAPSPETGSGRASRMMRRAALFATAATAAATCALGGQIAAAAPTSAATSAASRHVYVLSTENGLFPGDEVLRERPERFALGDAGMRGFKWSRWGSYRTAGRGRLVAFNTPRSGIPARMMLSAPKPCPGRGGVLVYTKVRLYYRFDGKRQRRVGRIDASC